MSENDTSAPPGIFENDGTAAEVSNNNNVVEDPSSNVIAAANNNESNNPPPLVDTTAAGNGSTVAAAINANNINNNPPQQQQPPHRAALANDLTTYFTNLSLALQQQQSNSSNDNNSATVSSSSSSSTVVITLLKDGISPIMAAANTNNNGRGSHSLASFMAFENSLLNNNNHTNATANAPPTARAVPPPVMTTQHAAMYLYAVSKNIVGLEAAVLGSTNASGSSNPAFAAAAAVAEGRGGGGGGFWGGAGQNNNNNGNGHVLGGGGVTAKQVAEIVMAVSIAATFCNSRSIICQSGILPALAHLIQSTGTVTAPPPTLMSQQSSKGGNSSGSGVLHSLTPFHSEFLQVALLAGQYRYASAFLASRPMSHTTLDFPYLRIDPTSYLRTHYYAGLVHVGCNDWDAALDSFHLCLTMPCSTVSAVSVAARKKSLLVQCLLLESDELDGNNANNSTKANAQERIIGVVAGKSPKSALEKKVLDLPGAASAAVCKYMSASSNRVGRNVSEGGSGSAPERTTAGSETSEQPPGAADGGGGRSSRRRMRSVNSNSSSDAAGGGESGLGGPSDGSKSKNYNLGSYHDLVSTYISGNANHYAKLLLEMMDLLHSDGNWGLAKQLEARLLAYRSIRKVASVYSVVGVNVLAKKIQEVGPTGEVGKHGIEDVLMGMAACDAKNPLIVDPFVAKIDQSTGMVCFLDQDDDESDDDCDDEAWMEADLSNRLHSCIALAERVRDLDIALTTSPKYMQYSMKEKMMKGDRGSVLQGSSVADIGHEMDIGADW